MLFIMGVTLYTSRAILQTLGIEDYGVYTIVGGIILMFAFINGGMVSATQRYLTYEIGKNNRQRLQKVFTTSLQIHAIIALIIILLGETIGLWFFYKELVIPAERMTAAFWVYQCSIASCVINIMSVPYNADIIAHEKMSAFAYISILEVILKLVIVYLLYITPWDRLITYAVLLLTTQIIVRSTYTRYCNKHFEESHYQHNVDKQLFKEMSTFAGWSFWGNLASILYTQGINIILNIFFGPIANAARGIAVQLQGATQQFVSNFQMALNPQITKNFATGHLTQMHDLMFRSARFSFFLLYFLSLPILLETEYILALWLKTVPENAVIFTRWMIGIALIYTIANPCVVANQATGKVKKYQAIVGGILLLIVPISYITLKLGAPAYSVFIVHFCIECIAQFARMYMLRNLIDLPISAYLKHIYKPIVIVMVLSCLCPILIQQQMHEGLLRLIVVSVVSLISVGTVIILIGITKNERAFIFSKIYHILRIKQ